MARGICPKAGIYFSHYECFGHTSRVIAVGGIFKKKYPRGDLFFIQAGVPQPLANLSQIGRTYSLPAAFTDRRHFRGLVQEAGGGNVDQRSQVCFDIINRERPDLFITEFFPLGRQECRHELIPSLVKASAQGAALWAVAGYPLLTGNSYEWRRKIVGLYQKIIIFSPSQEQEFIAASLPQASRQSYADFFKQYASKIIFAGYLLPQQEVVRGDPAGDHVRVPKGVCRVAVLRGGGAVYPKMIAQAIRASDLLGKEYHLTMVAGPSTTAGEWELFSLLFKKKKVSNAVLLRSVGDYEGLIEKSDVCVSMGAYHSSVMLLKHRKKAVIIPFEGQGRMSFYEQPSRAALLKDLLGARILPIQDLTASTLAAAIKAASSRITVSSSFMLKSWFGGAAFLERELTKLF